jgi:hypothetical protein
MLGMEILLNQTNLKKSGFRRDSLNIMAIEVAGLLNSKIFSMVIICIIKNKLGQVETWR